MPLLRLQYNGDNQYTTKDKRNLLLTQEVIEKINNMSPSQGGDVPVKIFEITDSSTPEELNMVVDFWELNTSGEQENLPIVVYNSYGLKNFFYPRNASVISKTVDDMSYSGYQYSFFSPVGTVRIKDFGDQIPTEFEIIWA